MAIYTSITDLIGGTPLLELKNYEAGSKDSGQAGIFQSRRQRQR